jgi:hypothetical protein
VVVWKVERYAAVRGGCREAQREPEIRSRAIMSTEGWGTLAGSHDQLVKPPGLSGWLQCNLQCCHACGFQGCSAETFGQSTTTICCVP